MSEIFSVQVTAAATVALAVLALLTAVLAYLAWRKQSREVRDQATMLRVQSEQLDEQRKINTRQTEVLELQARELSESLAERKEEALQRRRAQASQVFMWETRVHVDPMDPGLIKAHIKNSSDQPIRDVRFSWRYAGLPHHATFRQEPLMPGEQDNDEFEFPPRDDSWKWEGLPPDAFIEQPPDAFISFIGADIEVRPDATTKEFEAVVIIRDRAGTWWRARPDGMLDEVPPDGEPPDSW